MKKLVLYYLALITTYSAISSLPMHPNDASDMNKSGYQTQNSDEKPYNTTNDIKSKIGRSLKRPGRHPEMVNLQRRDGKSQMDYYTRNGVKRGLDIGIKLKFPTTKKYSENLNKLEEMLKNALGDGLGETFNSSACQNCEEKGEALSETPGRRRVKPAYACDDWDPNLRLCVLERNIGDTVTFYLSTKDFKGRKPNVTWKKEFHMQNTETRTGFVIDPENSPQNIIIGKQGYELRVSPITEIDVGYNLFSATIGGHFTRESKVHFVIRIVPVDLGFVYVGETIELSLRSFVSLPSESLTFKWYMEKYGEHSTLPSNMRTSGSGSSIKISELRQEQEGILACSVYTNLDFLATKKRFLLKDLVKNKDVLQSAPDHDLVFKEEQQSGRLKRDPKKGLRHKRDINIDDIVEKVLESTTTEKQLTGIPTQETTPRSYRDYDLQIDIGKGEPKMKSFENVENLDEFDQGQNEEDLGGPPQPTKQFGTTSAENNLAEMNVPGTNEYPQLQDSNSDTSPHMGTSMVGQFEKKPLKQHDGSSLLQSETNDHKASEQKLTSPKKTIASVKKYIDIGSKKSRYGSPQTEDSEIVLNIDKIPGPRRISAEENIGKLISSCYTDFECSAAATCIRTNLKKKGFCKCLPGYYGVGIFCREDIWLSKSNFDVEELHSPEDIPNATFPPTLQDNM